MSWSLAWLGVPRPGEAVTGSGLSSVPLSGGSGRLIQVSPMRTGTSMKWPGRSIDALNELSSAKMSRRSSTAKVSRYLRLKASFGLKSCCGSKSSEPPLSFLSLSSTCSGRPGPI